MMELNLAPIIKKDGATYIEVVWLAGQLKRAVYSLGYGVTFDQILNLIEELDKGEGL